MSRAQKSTPDQQPVFPCRADTIPCSWAPTEGQKCSRTLEEPGGDELGEEGMLGVRDQTTQSPHAQGPRQERGRAANLRKPEGDGGRAGAAKTSQSHGDTPGQGFEVFLAPRAVVWTAADRDKNSTGDHSSQPIITWFLPGM